MDIYIHIHIYFVYMCIDVYVYFVSKKESKFYLLWTRTGLGDYISYLSPHSNPCKVLHYNAHFTDEETGFQRG